MKVFFKTLYPPNILANLLRGYKFTVFQELREILAASLEMWNGKNNIYLIVLCQAEKCKKKNVHLLKVQKCSQITQ